VQDGSPWRRAFRRENVRERFGGHPSERRVDRVSGSESRVSGSWACGDRPVGAVWARTREAALNAAAEGAVALSAAAQRRNPWPP